MTKEEKGCTSKKSYDTEWEAVNMAAFVREMSKHTSIREYKCLYCAHWHIGHPSKSKYKKVVQQKG